MDNKRNNRKELDLTARYSACQMFYWMELVTISGYAAYYLRDAGMSNTRLGIVLSLGAAVSAIIQPLSAAYADKPQSPSIRQIRLWMSVVMFAIGAALIGLFHRSFPGTVILFFIVYVLMQVGKPFVNSLGSETINQKKKLNFGIARAFGSAGYMLLAFILGRTTQWKGAIAVPVIIMFVSAGSFISNYLFPFEKSGHGPGAAGQKQNDTAHFLHHYRYYMVSLAGCVGLSIGHVYLNNYLLQIVQSKGGGSGEMGNIMSLAAGLELAVMFGYGFFTRKASHAFWFRVSGIFFTLKVFASLLVPNLTALYAVQIFQPFGWGLYQVSSVYFINGIMEPEDKIKGQALFTSSHMVASVIGSLSGGILLDYGGTGAMLLTGTVISGAGAVLLMVFGRKAARTAKAEEIKG